MHFYQQATSFSSKQAGRQFSSSAFRATRSMNSTSSCTNRKKRKHKNWFQTGPFYSPLGNLQSPLFWSHFSFQSEAFTKNTCGGCTWHMEGFSQSVCGRLMDWHYTVGKYKREDGCGAIFLVCWACGCVANQTRSHTHLFKPGSTFKSKLSFKISLKKKQKKHNALSH